MESNSITSQQGIVPVYANVEVISRFEREVKKTACLLPINRSNGRLDFRQTD